jgi:6,7-dimethyl-8-ribityllumazine synthase
MIFKPHIMIVQAQFYEHISDLLMQGAVQAMDNVDASYECFVVPGALEIPGALRQGSLRATGPRFDAFVALGCVLRGETSHYDTVCNESARGLMDLTLTHGLAVGNGILTCENEQQALVRADPAQKNKGGEAVMAALKLLDIQRQMQGAK